MGQSTQTIQGQRDQLVVSQVPVKEKQRGRARSGCAGGISAINGSERHAVSPAFFLKCVAEMGLGAARAQGPLELMGIMRGRG